MTTRHPYCHANRRMMPLVPTAGYILAVNWTIATMQGSHQISRHLMQVNWSCKYFLSCFYDDLRPVVTTRCHRLSWKQEETRDSRHHCWSSTVRLDAYAKCLIHIHTYCLFLSVIMR